MNLEIPKLSIIFTSFADDSVGKTANSRHLGGTQEVVFSSMQQDVCI